MPAPTEDQLKELELMTHPDLWVNRPLLPMKKILSAGDREYGILVEGPMGRFVFYKGALLHAGPNNPANIKAMQNAKTYLAPGLLELIQDGWQVD